MLTTLFLFEKRAFLSVYCRKFSTKPMQNHAKTAQICASFSKFSAQSTNFATEQETKRTAKSGKRSLSRKAPKRIGRLGQIEDMRAKLRLDRRRAKADGTYPIIMYYNFKGRSVVEPTGWSVWLEQWDDEMREVVHHPEARMLNAMLHERIVSLEEALIRLQYEGALDDIDSVSEVRQVVGEYLGLTVRKIAKRIPNGGFWATFEEFAESRPAESTRETYRHTMRRIQAFDKRCEELRWEDVDIAWLRRFESFLAKTSRSANGRAILLRNIRAVFNYAIDDERTTLYPFRRFKIRTEQTRKRALTVEELREIIQLDLPEDLALHRDVFLLSFCLIGINMVDLSQLTEVKRGRVEYKRAKTGRLYSIKVEPETERLLKRLKGRKLLVGVFEGYKNYKDYIGHCNDALKKLGRVHIGKQGRRTFEPICDELTTYWARHTWATLASRLDIPKDTIRRALGHADNSVTDIYIDFDDSKIDEANRKVLDYVFGGIANW